MAIQEAFEEGNMKDTPSFWTEDLEVIHRSGSEAGLLGIYNFPGEIEKFIIRQPPMGEKDDYDSENSWISDGLPSSSRRRRRGGGRWEVGEWREK